MNTIQERIELPDASEKPLVHPLDVPTARRTFAISWWLGQLTNPSLIFALAATLWVIHNNFFTPILTAIIITISAALASRYYDSEAWAFIPRKRQDEQRQVPLVWGIVETILTPLAMLVGLVLLLGWIIDRGFPPEIAAVTAGIVLGIAVIMAVTTVWNLMVPTRLRTESTSRLPQLFTGLVLIAVAIYGSIVLPQTALAEGWQTNEIVLGLAMILGIQLCWSLISRIPRRTTD